MMQGDQYQIPIGLKLNGKDLTPELVQDVEVYLGHIRKTLSAKEVTFDVENNKFLFPVTQEETFKLAAQSYPVYVRVNFKEGWTQGVVVGTIDVTRAPSRQVL